MSHCGSGLKNQPCSPENAQAEAERGATAEGRPDSGIGDLVYAPRRDAHGAIYLSATTRGTDLHALAPLECERFVAAPAATLDPAGARHIAASGCSHITLHQQGANPPSGQAAQAIGRTKGGLNTKLAGIVARHGRAVDF